MRHVEIRVTGRVQGVFYRLSAQNAAIDLGVKGNVRNEPDGSVLIRAAAEAETLERFVEWCRKGPANADVEHVIVQDAEPVDVEGFVITG